MSTVCCTSFVVLRNKIKQNQQCLSYRDSWNGLLVKVSQALDKKRQINISLDRDTASRFYDYNEI